MEVNLSAEAITAAHRLQLEQPEWRGKVLRLYLDGKGCDGFYYGVSFDEALAGDHHFYFDGIELVVDADTLEYVNGSTIQWVDDERGRGFLVDNPGHKKYRGKFFKRPAWQTKLGERQGQT